MGAKQPLSFPSLDKTLNRYVHTSIQFWDLCAILWCMWLELDC